MVKKEDEVCKIYCLSNSIDTLIYIGQTWDEYEARMGTNGVGYRSSPGIYAAIQKYGTDKFSYTTLKSTISQAEANNLEAFYIEQYNSTDPDIGYNFMSGGGSGGRHAEETKQKIGENNAKFWLGKHLSEETKQKISEAKLGVPVHTPEWKEQNSAMMIERHATQGHPMQGKHHTEEAKQAMSEKLTGKKRDPESVAKGALKHRKNTDKDSAIIHAYLEEAKTIKQIQEEFGVGHVHRILERNGIELKGNHKRRIGIKASDETKSKLSENKKAFWASKKSVIGGN
jgi:group I intron endonuclease